MKLFILNFLLLFLFSYTIAQKPFVIHKQESDGNFTAKEVTHMAVLPECQQYKSENISTQIKCMSSNLNQSLGKYLDKFVETYESLGFISAETKVRFVISKEGKIRNIEGVKDSLKVKSIGDLLFENEAIKAIERIAKNMKPISPAKLMDGQTVNLQFDLPIFFKHENTKLEGIKKNEMTVLTLFDQTKKIEFREPSNARNKIKVYEIIGKQEKHIKSYNDLDAAVKSSEFFDIYQTAEKKNLIAEQYINGTRYRMYNSLTKNGWVDVYQINDGKEQLRESFNFSDVIFSELYLKILFR